VSIYPDGTEIYVTSNAGDIGGSLARDVATRPIESIVFGPRDSVSSACGRAG
jgi:hypothetical protein